MEWLLFTLVIFLDFINEYQLALFYILMFCCTFGILSFPGTSCTASEKNLYTHSAFLSNFPQALFMHVNLCLFYVINYSKLWGKRQIAFLIIMGVFLLNKSI
ncbi:hypothetical protein OIU84_011470 [Salix udensis]|uniref:Uncharacterized protein n=1 Tax=Salix udensis TaxID=889485 RepID=A0AAD6JN16_9ROSI|nr:hypothetical protein OIU84_011470 [Salix udensis]